MIENTAGVPSVHVSKLSPGSRKLTKSEQQTAFQNFFNSFKFMPLTVTASKEGVVIVVQLLN